MMLLKVENLTKIFESGFIRIRSLKAVDNVSFTINEGEVVSIVGESGSGKSTLARMILRLLPPTSGRILYKGKDIWRDFKSSNDLKNYWKEVHAVFQDPYSSFNPYVQVNRVLYQALKLIGINPKSEEGKGLIEESLIRVGLNPSDVLGKYPHQLSGGQRQRLMIARNWIIKPKLLIADEAVSMIDASMRGTIIKLLLEMREALGTSIIFITHDIGLAYHISDRILVMYRGRLVEEGTPDDIINNPKHEYTMKLIKSVPLLYNKWTFD
ncbi:MAG: ABC transporter ATP-binding protein [Staphylothermus sp.]|nr:ABC transporter ATP-binding protein [Staphylothermus sp.]